MADYKDLDSKVIKLSKQIVRMCTEAGSGHPSSALSLVHLTVALMYRVMRYDPRDPWNTRLRPAGAVRRSRRAGHLCGLLRSGRRGGHSGPADCLDLRRRPALRENDSVLDGHPNPAIGFPFFDAATGSLGQGLSVSAGLACAARLDGSDKKIFCFCGDGESREGQIWEALDFIVDHKLTAVRAIFNCNGQAQSDYVSPQQSAEVLAEKLRAFGLEVKAIDGHNWDEIFTALKAQASRQAPGDRRQDGQGLGRQGASEAHLSRQTPHRGPDRRRPGRPGRKRRPNWAWPRRRTSPPCN